MASRMAVVSLVVTTFLVADANADQVCRKKKGQLLARSACKTKEAPLDLVTLLTPGDGLSLAGNTLGIADAGVTGGKLADGAVTTSKIADGGVTADKIADHTRTMYFPAAALSYDDGPSDPFSRTGLGLRIAPHGAGLNGNPPPFVVIVPKPTDIDDTAPVDLHLYLVFTSGPSVSNNTVHLRIKPYAVAFGDSLANAAWINGPTTQTVVTGYQVDHADFTLAKALAELPVWYLQFGRGDTLNGENYPYDVTVAGLEVAYTAVQ